MSIELLKRLRSETSAGMMACQKALEATNNDYDAAVDLLRKQGIAKASLKTDRGTNEGLCCVLTNDKGIAVVKLNCETDFVSANEKFQQLIETLTSIALNNGIDSVEKLLNHQVDGKNVSDIIKENIAVIGENIVLGDVKFYQLDAGNRADYYVHNCVSNKQNIGRIVSFIISKNLDNELDDNKKNGIAVLLRQINMHIAAMSPIALTENRISEDILSRERDIYKEQVAKLNKPEDIALKMIEGKMRKFYEESVLLKQIFVMDNKKNVGEVISDFNKKNKTELEILDFEKISIK